MNFLSKHRYIILLFILGILISFLNFTPNTWLTGWDTLHPELDYDLNISRLISGVWRDDQGLGSVAGHSHMSDLPRVVILYAFNLFLPTSSVRYAYVFLMYVLGSLGMYMLISYAFKTNVHRKMLGFIGGLYYMLNAGAIQQFYVPFEMFTTQYGYLPWILLYSLKVLEKFNRRNLFIFSLLTLLATPQAYAAQLWYAFFGTFLLFLLTRLFLTSSNKATQIRRTLILILLTLFINAFWLLPNMYYITTQGQTPRLAKQNKLYSQEFLQRNRASGTLQEVPLLKGFYFDWSVFNFTDDKFEDLMPTWKAHYNNIAVKAIGYIFFILILYGLLLTFTKKSQEDIPKYFIPFFLVSFTLLANRIIPFSYIFDGLIRASLFEEALRFVFTKLSILLTFSYTIFLIVALAHILRNKSKQVSAGILILVISCTIFLGFPVFQKNLISDKVRVSIPSDYFDMWSFMRLQPQGTVLSLPLYTFSGWQYYNWGYQGSGFLWFPLTQSLLDRDSDRWNNYNEEAFREIQYAVYSKNTEGFKNTLEKYNVSYILWDKNNSTPEEKNKDQITFTREINSLLGQLSEQNVIENIWEKNDISIYRIPTINKAVSLLSDIPNILPSYTWSHNDTAFASYGIYKSDSTLNPDMFYPFRNYLNEFDRLNRSLISIDTEKKTYGINIPQSNLFETKLVVPDLKVESEITADTYLHKISETKIELILKPILPQQNNITGIIELVEMPKNSISINGDAFPIGTIFDNNNMMFIGKANFYPDRDNIISGKSYIARFNIDISEIADISGPLPPQFIQISADEIFNANPQNADAVLSALESDQNYVRITSKAKDTSGILLDLPNLNQSKGYIISVSTRNIQGIPLRICLFSLYSNLCTLYDEVSGNKEFAEDTFIVPPYTDATGYSLRLDNIAYGNEKAINDILYVTIFPLPYNFLTQTRLETRKTEKANLVSPHFVPYLNNTLYIVEANEQTITNSELVLWRSFNNGWLAINTNTMSLLPKHHLVNNWANGWTLDQNQFKDGVTEKIVLFFWPQLLQYAGFVLLASTFLGVIIFYRKAKASQQDN